MTKEARIDALFRAFTDAPEGDPFRREILAELGTRTLGEVLRERVEREATADTVPG